MPPPPPPPGAPPPPSFSLGSVKPAGERKDLLKDIQAGAKLRKTTTNDRSAPIVSTGKASTPAPSGGGGGGRAENNSSQNVGPLPGIGGLFAGGIPTLKKTKGGVSTGRSNNDFAPLNRDPTPGNGSLYKNSYNSTSSSLDISKKSCDRTRGGGSLHSYYFGETPDIISPEPTLCSIPTSRPGRNNGTPSNGTPTYGIRRNGELNGINGNNQNYSIQKTTSTDSMLQKAPVPPKPGKLSKTKSSTFISPEQSEKIMYNTRVTLTLRRSRQNLNEDDGDPVYSRAPVRENYFFGENGGEDTRMTPSCVPNGRVRKRAEELRSACPTPPPLAVKPSLQHTFGQKGLDRVSTKYSSSPRTNSLLSSSIPSSNSSPSLSPSPSPVGSTPTRGPPFPSSAPPLASSAPPPPPSNPKPSVPNTKPNLTPRGPSGSPGLVHPSSKPPPPPPSKPGVSSSNLNLARNQTVSKSFNQTIGHGPQGRPVLHNLGERTTKDDTSIRNGHAPPPPLRTVSQAQITTNKLPTRAPPPPPPGHKRPSQPPPPPPSNPPPPPGIQPPNKALPPPPPNHLSGDPPTPPTRRDSMYRAGHNSSGYNSSASSTGESFESRFSSRFKAPQFLPPPEPFSGCQKTYPSKNTIPVRHGSQIKRTPAPPPPPGKGQAAYGSLGRAPSAPRLWTTTTTGVL